MNVTEIMESYNDNPTKELSRELIDKLGNDVDTDYKILLTHMIKTVTEPKDEINNANKNKNKNINKNEDNKDPHYAMYLKNLVSTGKSYKLKISENEFLTYEEESDEEYKANGKEGEILEASRRKKKIRKHKSVVTEPNECMSTETCYQMFLKGSIPSEYGKYDYEGKIVKYEEKVTKSSSDSDVEILDDFNEVNNKRKKPAEKESSLKEKLIEILKKPYNKKEYEQLSEFIEQKKPVSRTLALRGRAVSSAMNVGKKSVLDDSPGIFRRKFIAAQNEGEQHKALNLLRMFSFWLEHLPNDEIFKPWLDNECLKVLPMRRTK